MTDALREEFQEMDHEYRLKTNKRMFDILYFYARQEGKTLREKINELIYHEVMTHVESG